MVKLLLTRIKQVSLWSQSKLKVAYIIWLNLALVRLTRQETMNTSPVFWTQIARCTELKPILLSLLWISEVLACLPPSIMIFLTYYQLQLKVQLAVSLMLAASVSFRRPAKITNLFGILIHSKFSFRRIALNTLTFLWPLSQLTTNQLALA